MYRTYIVTVGVAYNDHTWNSIEIPIRSDCIANAEEDARALASKTGNTVHIWRIITTSCFGGGNA